MEDADAGIVLSDGWYRLAAAVVRGLPQDDPQRDAWRQWGEELRRRLNAQPRVQITGATRPGHMHADFVDHARSTHAPGRRRARTQA